MSRFTDAAITSHRLSIVAMEEASRTGQPEPDIDHLFLALSASEHAAGEVLRSLGITLETARAAVRAEHGESVASLGLDLPAPEEGPITFPDTRDYTWTARARAVFDHASAEAGRGDAAAVLRALVAEPSGLIEQVLRRLGTTPSDVRERLDDATRAGEAANVEGAGADSRNAVRVGDAFVAAGIGDVWALISDPARLPEWVASLASIEAREDETPLPGTAWSGVSRTHSPEGKPLKVRPEHVRQRIELHESVDTTRVAWRLTCPDDEAAAVRTITIALSPATEGTRLEVTNTWQRPGRPTPGAGRRLTGTLLRPVHRFMTNLQTQQLCDGIRRAVLNQEDPS